MCVCVCVCVYIYIYLCVCVCVCVNRVLRRIFGPKRDDVTRQWRKLHNEELNDLYCSLNIIRAIKSRIR